jgi:predicted dienelactone hydrolase
MRDLPARASKLAGLPLLIVALAIWLARPCNASYTVQTVDSMTLHDWQRQRDIPIKIYYPLGVSHAPLIIFSHGYGSDKNGYTYLAQGWASAGYVVILPTHHGGDRQAALAGGFSAMFHGESVVTVAQLEDNAHDISFIISSLNDISRQAPELAGAIDSQRIGVAGHSMGAGTTLVVAGATLPGGSSLARDSRPLAFVAISPQGMYTNEDAHRWDGVTRPTLTMYGSNDIGEQHQPSSWRRDPFDHMPPGNKYNLVVDGANHFSFADEAKLPAVAAMLAQGQTHSIDQIHNFVVGATLVFWNAYLKNDPAALSALRSGKPLVPGELIGTLTLK